MGLCFSCFSLVGACAATRLSSPIDRGSGSSVVGFWRRRLVGGFTLANGGSGEIVPLVDGFDGALEAAEEGLGAEEGGGEVDCV